MTRASSGTGTARIDDGVVTFAGDPPGTAAMPTSGSQSFTATHRTPMFHRLNSKPSLVAIYGCENCNEDTEIKMAGKLCVKMLTIKMTTDQNNAGQLAYNKEKKRETL